jgi:excisionase family DNA binding protein
MPNTEGEATIAKIIPVTMTAQEAADYLGISYWLILELAKRKDIKHARAGLGRGNLLFRKETLDNWLMEQEEKSIQKTEYGKIRKIRG